MSSTPSSSTPENAPLSGSAAAFQVSDGNPLGSPHSESEPDWCNISGLLQDLRTASQAVCVPPSPGSVTGADQREQAVENRLAVVRLGIASSLFYALRSKHPATAAHGLRVALFCSGWAERMGLVADLQDRIEVAALLHDVGKIGVPDKILRKAGKLTVDQQLVMDGCPEISCEILRGCTADTELLDIVRYHNVWFESRRGGESPRGDAIPLGSRMLAIADAFDAMTTDQVYRSAMSRDRAIAELIEGSRTQFDPDLVVDFCRLLESSPELLQGSMINRWLQQLRPEDSQAFWTGHSIAEKRLHASDEIVRRETRFNSQLLHSLKDGVAFTDADGNIDQWNIALERLTGLPADAMIGKQWSSQALGLRDADRDQEQPATCPMQECVRVCDLVRRAMVIESSAAERISVHVEVAPVFGDGPGMIGTVIVVHDLSDREHLEKRLQKLHKQSTLDALTRVANRAHFDSTLDQLVAATEQGGPSFALVICDIDHFKRINDTYGHPAGDEALRMFGRILKEHSREGDLVARYGGEEFLLLAVACDNATGARRAEVLRRALESTPIECLDRQCITASFGVTEYQSGDTAKTVLARADRALLKAKDNGRNRVVQLGLGRMSEVAEPAQRSGWFDWFGSSDANSQTSVDILTPVPIDLAIEKLRGFIADHHAEIINVAENQVSLKVVSGSTPGGRRRVDHSILFQATLTLSEAQKDELLNEKQIAGSSTKVHLELKPIRNRDRRRSEMKDAVQQLIASFRCYLMGEVISDR